MASQEKPDYLMAVSLIEKEKITFKSSRDEFSILHIACRK